MAYINNQRTTKEQMSTRWRVSAAARSVRASEWECLAQALRQQDLYEATHKPLRETLYLQHRYILLRSKALDKN